MCIFMNIIDNYASDTLVCVYGCVCVCACAHVKERKRSKDLQWIFIFVDITTWTEYFPQSSQGRNSNRVNAGENVTSQLISPFLFTVITYRCFL